MRNKDNERYIKLGITGVVVVMVGLVCWFVFANFEAVADFFSVVAGLLMPFLYGAVIAYILSPVCNRIEAFLRRRVPGIGKAAGGLAILGAMLLAVVMVVAFFALVIPGVASSIVQIVNVLPSQMATASEWLYELLESQPELQAQWDQFSDNINETISSWLQTDLLSTVQLVASNLSGQVTGLINVLKNLFLGILISVYLLGGRKKFARQARMLLAGAFPRKWADKVEEEVRFADRMFNGFLVGRIVDSAIIGLICFVFTMICRFDSAVLVSVVVGVTNVIPVFGPFLGAIPCAFILLLENPVHCVIFLVFVVVLQQIDGNVIGPRILGSTTGVDSFWVLFSVLFFGGLWGLAGMIVGVPLFAVLYDILRQLVHRGLAHKHRDDLLAPTRQEEDAPAAPPEEGAARAALDAPDAADGAQVGVASEI